MCRKKFLPLIHPIKQFRIKIETALHAVGIISFNRITLSYTHSHFTLTSTHELHISFFSFCVVCLQHYLLLLFIHGHESVRILVCPKHLFFKQIYSETKKHKIRLPHHQNKSYGWKYCHRKMVKRILSRIYENHFPREHWL